jgi:hypothetical protein
MLFWLSYALFEDVRFVFHVYSLLWFIKPKIGGPLWKLKIRISTEIIKKRKKKKKRKRKVEAAKTENSDLNQTFIFLG